MRDDEVGHEMEWMCPINGDAGAAWGGNDGYSWEDSSICRAAVHAGFISEERGGYVTVRKVPGIDYYEPIDQNDVQSLSRRPGDDPDFAFIFID